MLPYIIDRAAITEISAVQGSWPGTSTEKALVHFNIDRKENFPGCGLFFHNSRKKEAALNGILFSVQCWKCEPLSKRGPDKITPE